jgi:hypothetical protein
MTACRSDSAPATPQAQDLEPILCRCSEWRYGRMADHHDWTAELKRDRREGRLLDEVWFAAVEIEARLDRAETSA